jgi:fumarate reductase subunit D
MADLTVTSYGVPRAGASWSSVFAGVFVFLAIETTFGILGSAIFSSAVNSVGFGIWMIILSIISLYFAGRAASHLAGCVRRLDGMYHGLVTYGLSVFTTVLVLSLVLGSAALASTNAAHVSKGTLLDYLSTGGWYVFIAMILGGIAACIGGAHSIRHIATAAPEQQRPRDLRAA